MNLKRYFQIVLAAMATCLISAGCTHNNGSIGEWFGEWMMQSVEINGMDDDTYKGDVLWKFQNDIVEMVVIDGHSHTEHYGTWSDTDGELILNFSHSDDLTQAGTGKYAPPAQTYLPAAIVSLKIIKLSSPEIVLQYAPEGSATIVYTLRKRG